MLIPYRFDAISRRIGNVASQVVREIEEIDRKTVSNGSVLSRWKLTVAIKSGMFLELAPWPELMPQ